MPRPTYCPMCGKTLPDGPHGAQPFSEPDTGDGGWDCYCDFCKWSGDIMPNSEHAAYETQPPYGLKTKQKGA